MIGGPEIGVRLESAGIWFWVANHRGHKYIYYKAKWDRYRTHYLARLDEAIEMAHRGIKRAMAKISAKTGLTFAGARAIAKALKGAVRARLMHAIAMHELAQRPASARSVDVDVRTARETYKDKKKITTGAKELDELLEGGIETGAITELAGEHGAGKTQLCHQLAVMAQLPEDRGGLGAKVAYIDTEGTFSHQRIAQIARARGLDPDRALENIYHFKAHTLEEQIASAEKAKELVGNGVKLVIVDSLIAHFRAEYPGRENLAERQKTLLRHMAELLKLARRHDVAVVVTNHAVTTPEAKVWLITRPRLMVHGGAPAMPAGGNVVAHLSTYRIWLRKGKWNIRAAKIFDSPYHPEGEALFKITDEGIVDLEQR